MAHVIILPYFSRIEVDRYLKIIRRLASFPKSKYPIRFLLANSAQTAPDSRLSDACQEIAPTFSFQCPTEVFGYPEGPTAMFWDAMDYIDKHWGSEEGFSLWLESDMIPAHENWIDRLSDDWFAAENPMLMGCYVPPVYKRRLLRKWKFMLDEHINGGACYAKNLSSLAPEKAREDVFDMAVYHTVRELGDVIKSDKIAFSTVKRARRDIICDSKVLLHGFMQDKDQFIDECVKPVSEQEIRLAKFHPTLDRLENFKRGCRVWFFKFGYEAMFENMMLTKSKMENRKRAA